MDIRKLQKIAVTALEDVKAKDIEVINTSKLSALFDRVIIATGDSNRHVKALARSVHDKAREADVQVIGIEGDLPLVNHAKENARHNNISNAEFYVADLSKDISDMPWAKHKFNKIMLDPSRAGASEVLHHFKKWQPELIVYVSCNPSTLARDAGILVNELGYKLVKAGVMNMFPQTGHVESMALFQKA